MRFGLVRGRSPVSGAIQWFTRSVYSHANVVFRDGVVYEAEPQGFVRAASLAVNNAGCVVDLLEYKDPLTEDEEIVARAACETMVGEDYDYAMLVGFLGRFNFEPPASRRKLFCSEACMVVSLALGPGRRLLERVPPWKVPPEGINLSPLLKWVETVVPKTSA